jgi:hypothetical protein
MKVPDTVSRRALVTEKPEESVTRKVREEEPGVVGVPERTPVEELREMPVGREPAWRAQDWTGLEPEAAREKEKGVPLTAVGREEVEMARLLTTRENSRESVSNSWSATSRVKVKEPKPEGVPERTPSVLSVRPCGREPEETDQL